MIGTLYSTNITPDAETGIGGWSDDEFVRTLHEGIGKDGEHLYPAFPYASYTLMTRDDALAIKAYLFSLKAIKYTPPPNDISFPFNQRYLMTFWNILFNPDHRFRPNADQPPEWNRGAYLVEALGHCGDCHTPRNLLFGLKRASEIRGRGRAGLEGVQHHARPGLGHRRLVGGAAARLSFPWPRRGARIGERADGRGGRQQPALSERRRHQSHGHVFDERSRRKRGRIGGGRARAPPRTKSLRRRQRAPAVTIQVCASSKGPALAVIALAAKAPCRTMQRSSAREA